MAAVVSPNTSSPTLVGPVSSDKPASPTVEAPTSLQDTAVASKLEAGAGDAMEQQHILATLGQTRKNFLLLIFSIATFVDICNVSGVAVAVAQIGQDIGLDLSQLVWVSALSKLCPVIVHCGAELTPRSSLHTRYVSRRCFFCLAASQICTTPSGCSLSASW